MAGHPLVVVQPAREVGEPEQLRLLDPELEQRRLQIQFVRGPVRAAIALLAATGLAGMKQKFLFTC